MSYGKRKTPAGEKNAYKRDDTKDFNSVSGKKSKRGRNAKGDEKFNNSSHGFSTLHNDPSWYEPFSGSTELVARKSFGTPLGANIRHPDYKSFMVTDDTENSNHAAFPGIMRIGYVSVPGFSRAGDYSSAINTAAHAYYTTVRYAQRGSGTYDDADLMLGNLAIFSLYELWAYMRRLYGVLNMYSVSNKYLSEALFSSMGGNFTDFQSHIYDLQGFVNNFALKVSEFCLPADFSVVSRRIRLNSNIYVDSTSTKAQMYYFHPDYFWKYDELQNEAGGMLLPVSLPEEFTFQQLVDFANDVYYGLRSSSSLMNMTGDVKNAYGVENIMKMAAMSEEYMVPILYDEEMCMEIQNLNLVGTFRDDSLVLAASDTNTIDTFYQIVYPRWVVDDDIDAFHVTANFINMRKESPTAYDVMRASRLMTFGNFVLDNGSVMFDVTECGTEICTTATIYWWVINEAGQRELVNLPNIVSWNEKYDAINLFDLLTTVSLCEKFDFHPYMYYVMMQDHQDPVCHGMYGDVDNISIITRNEVNAMNQYALLGLFKTKRMDLFFNK